MRLPARWFFLSTLLALPAIGLLFAAAQDAGSKTNPHAAGKVNLPPGASEVGYCNGCHKEGCPVPHPELVKMNWQAKGRAVLGINGETTCGSCHTRGFRRRSEAFIARDQKSLCNNCHFGSHAISKAHTSGQRCEACHTKPGEVLAHTTPVETRLMKTGVDNECQRCHFDGPVTHSVGVPNSKKKAPDLPLSADGKITCITCHIGHNQQDRFGVLLRKDNRRGGLCLSCHDDL
jgi:predicted CXXCH cytochrome family protein